MHRLLVETEDFFVCITQLREFNEWVLNGKNDERLNELKLKINAAEQTKLVLTSIPPLTTYTRLIYSSVHMRSRTKKRSRFDKNPEAKQAETRKLKSVENCLSNGSKGNKGLQFL